MPDINILKKQHFVWFHLYEMSIIGNLIDIEIKLVVIYGWEGSYNGGLEGND